MNEPGLSPRQLQVLRGLARGLSYEQIGAELGLSVGTTSSYVQRIFAKLGAHNARLAVARGYELGVLKAE